MGFTAAFYDATLWVAERRGMSDRRAGVIAEASGRTLEIGAGTGLNLRHYPAAVTELVLSEPVKPMAVRLERRARKRNGATVVHAPAERLPFEDDSFDTVVATLVFCTVEDPERAAAEVARVLKPGGRLLFIEHVRAHGDERLARRQERLAGIWRAFADGCNCNVSIADHIGSAFAIERAEESDWRAMPSIVRPLVAGSARAVA